MDQWIFNGHICKISSTIWIDQVRKNYYHVTKPDGTQITADIDPHLKGEKAKRALELWIIAEYPGRTTNSPLKESELTRLSMAKIDPRSKHRVSNVATYSSYDSDYSSPGYDHDNQGRPSDHPGYGDDW